jgi:hypothetical protein
MTRKLLPLADAFRAIMRAAHPERNDLQQIDSYRWFHDRQLWTTNDGVFGNWEDKPAYDALERLKDGVKSQKIRLRGCLKGAAPNDIDPIDASEGELDVFAGVLKIYEGNATSRIARTYTSVHCFADDLPKEKRRSGPGAPELYDWVEIRLFTFKQLTDYGDFGLEKNRVKGWRSAADLYGRIEDHLGPENCPGLSQLKEKVPPLVDEWRRMQDGN